MPETQSDDAVIRASIKMNTLLLLGKVVASVITTRTSPVRVDLPCAPCARAPRPGS